MNIFKINHKLKQVFYFFLKIFSDPSLGLFIDHLNP